MDDNKKHSIPRGKSATTAKNKYRDKNYDRMELAVPKGMKSEIETAYKEMGYPSKNAFITDAVREKYFRYFGKEMELDNN